MSRDMSLALARLLSESAALREEPADSGDARSSIRYILQHNLNATDALHLLVALRIDGSVDEPVVMVSADSRLLRAAEAEGLLVLNPEVASPDEVQALVGTT